MQKPDSNGYYWIEGMKLFLGVWQGTREGRTGYWLRWWNEEGELLLWGFELVQQERQRADLERKLASEEKRRADREQLRAERLLEQLRAAGLEPENS